MEAQTLSNSGLASIFEACWAPNQGFLSRYIMSKDPGQNIPTEQTYRQLAGDVFKNVNAWVDTNPLRIPYVMIFLECQSDAGTAIACRIIRYQACSR